MGFLILSRREGEGITLSLKADYPAEELIRQLREGGIRILVTDIIGNQARVGIEAPRGVLIVRDELKTAPKGLEIKRASQPELAPEDPEDVEHHHHHH